MELKSVFGRELQLEHFRLTKLHAAVLGLDSDAIAAEDMIRMAPRDMVDEVNQTGRGALSWACAQGDLSTVESLLGKGADPNLADSEGRTHLYHKSNCVNERCVEDRWRVEQLLVRIIEEEGHLCMISHFWAPSQWRDKSLGVYF